MLRELPVTDLMVTDVTTFTTDQNVQDAMRILVTEDVDAGPILAQEAVPVLDEDTVDTLSARILVEEHRVYPEAVGMILNGGWRLEGRRFVAAGATNLRLPTDAST